MLVAIGSKNPVKVNAVRVAFSKFFKEFEVRSLEVESGVSTMPFDEELLTGAINRAKNALAGGKANFGVGLEGGIIQVHGVDYIGSFVAVTNGVKTHGAYSQLWECPPKVLQQVKAGKELGHVIDELTGKKETKKDLGAIGVFTKGAITREQSFSYAAICALTPFVNQEHY